MLDESNGDYSLRLAPDYACTNLLTTPVSFAVGEDNLLNDILPLVHEVQNLLCRKRGGAKTLPELLVSWTPVTPDNWGVHCCDELMPKVCRH